MSLHDPYLTEVLKIQVQILGVPQARDAIQATLHWHTPWNIDCDCKGCQEGDLDDADKSKSGKKCENSEKEFKRRFDGGDPTIGSLSRPGNYEFLVSYKTQNELDKCPQGSSLFQFFDHQRQDMGFISDRILELKYGRIESAENPIPLPTSFPLSPETHSILRQDNPFSIFNDYSHMPLSFAPIPDENKFDIAKFFWDQKDGAAAQKKIEAALRKGKRKMDLHTRTNNKVVPISSHIAPSGDLVYLDPGPSIQHVDLEVSKYDVSSEDHKLIKHGLPYDGGVHHEKSILDNDLINFDQEVSQLYNLDKEDNLDSILLIEETLSGNEEFYDAMLMSHLSSPKASKGIEEEVKATGKPDDIVTTEEPPEVTPISRCPESRLKDVPKWDRLIQVIAFMDTGVAASMLNPTILPKEQWIPHFHNFNTASKGILTTRVITKNLIIIEFFPGVQFRTKLLGSIIPGTKLIIGFEYYKQLNDRLNVNTQGIAFRDKFKQYTTTTRLFPFTEDERVKNIKSLLEYGLIEPSDSQWSCEAFYFNKQVEQARAKAKYFSKFDLKSGFWQLGIHPKDKFKTGFYIPDHHYQWKVMPFGLKPAPSLFQRTDASNEYWSAILLEEKDGQRMRHFQDDSEPCPTRNRKNRSLSFCDLRPNMVTIGGWKKDIKDHLQHLLPLHNQMTPDDICNKITTYLPRFTAELPSKVAYTPSWSLLQAAHPPACTFCHMPTI
ncbi:hypothetical protein KY290_000996 [Solanum tuberosum]|uniref:Reverse transcriptase domain-containing protein n=1 Tax=Solanum tuberosum TaxID=4113 RepID=A0ABQ7WL23_SOLTU|nr:hypothetical protein KY290_000996 [Solanum tuberosum]